MQKRSVFEAESNRGLVKKFLSGLTLKVYADDGSTDPIPGDPNNSANPNQGGLTLNFEQMIAQARKEEKELTER